MGLTPTAGLAACWSLRIPEATRDQTLTRSQHTWPSLSWVAGGASEANRAVSLICKGIGRLARSALHFPGCSVLWLSICVGRKLGVKRAGCSASLPAQPHLRPCSHLIMVLFLDLRSESHKYQAGRVRRLLWGTLGLMAPRKLPFRPCFTPPLGIL